MAEQNNWGFSTTANTVTVDVPTEYEAREEKAQAIDFTAAGDARVYDKGVSTYWLTATLKDLTADEKDDLRVFFHNDASDTPKGVDGMAIAFTLTIHTGDAYSARFAKPEIHFTPTGSDAKRWSCTLQMILTTMVDD